MNLSGKNVIVTGGSNGIGWQIVINLLAKNVQVSELPFIKYSVMTIWNQIIIFL